MKVWFVRKFDDGVVVVEVEGEWVFGDFWSVVGCVFYDVVVGVVCWVDDWVGCWFVCEVFFEVLKVDGVLG